MSERHGLHLAEVLQLAIQEGPAGPDLLPEQKLVDRHRKTVQRSKMEALAAVGGVAAIVAGVLGARKALASKTKS